MRTWIRRRVVSWAVWWMRKVDCSGCSLRRLWLDRSGSWTRESRASICRLYSSVRNERASGKRGTENYTDSFRSRATYSDSDNMRAAVKEVLALTDQSVIGRTHDLAQIEEIHCRDKLLVVHRRPITQQDPLAFRVHELNPPMFTKDFLVSGQSPGDIDPDIACSAVGWKAKRCIGTPVTCCFVANHICRYHLEIWRCHALAEPLALHLRQLCQGQGNKELT